MTKQQAAFDLGRALAKTEPDHTQASNILWAFCTQGIRSQASQRNWQAGFEEYRRVRTTAFKDTF